MPPIFARYHCSLTVAKSVTWWRHQMETFLALLTICAGNSPVTSEFSTKRPVTQSFDVFFDLHLNKWMNKQSWGWWFGTPSHPLWHHRNEILMGCSFDNQCFDIGNIEKITEKWKFFKKFHPCLSYLVVEVKSSANKMNFFHVCQGFPKWVLL